MRWSRRSVAQRVPSSGKDPSAAARAPEQHDGVAGGPGQPGRRRVHGVDEAEHAEHRRGVDVGAPALVVEADVAADDREREGAAGLGHAVDALGELPHDLGVLGVPEVQAVHDGGRRRPDTGQVGDALGEHERGAAPRVERAGPRVRVRRERHAAVRRGQPGAGQAEQRGVGARPGHRVEEELVVVLAVDPARRAQQRQQVGGAVGRRRRRAARRARRLARAVVERCVVGQRGGGDVGQHGAVHAVADAQAAAPAGLGLRDRADDGGPHLPLGADGRHRRPRLGRDDGQHALLALAGHHLPGLHALLAPRHRRHVDVHADAAASGRLAGGAGQAGAAEVLDADDELRVEQLEAGLNQPLLLEGVAHLHAGALGVVGRTGVVAAEAGRGQDADAADAVAPGARPEQHGQVPGAGRDAEHEALDGQRAHAEHVDQRVLGVAGVEGELAAHGRHPDRVAVARDTAHDALDQPALPGVVGRAEEEGVHDGQRARPHGEDVAQNAAHPGGGALVGLDGRGMVVALDADRHGDAVAGVDHPGVLAGAHQDPRPLGRQAAQVQPGRLVRAVLAPHHGVEGQLEVVGGPAQDFADSLELVVGQAERPVQRLSASFRAAAPRRGSGRAAAPRPKESW